MNPPPEEESVVQKKKAAARQRFEEHVAWKRTFLQTRPAPPPIGQLHRRQYGKTKDHTCHAAFRVALQMVLQGKDSTGENTHVEDEGAKAALREATAASVEVPASEKVASGFGETIPRPAPQSTTVTTAVSPPTAVSAPTRQEAWAAQLLSEKERRNTATDLHIRSDPTRTVIMANLHPDTVEEDLRTFADQFGRVLQVRIVRHRTTGKSRRYAFVEFNLAGEARKALQFHRKKRLKGHSVIIDQEKGRTEAGFLPKRLATAAPFWASLKVEKEALTERQRAAVEPTNSPATGDAVPSSVAPSAAAAALVAPVPESDDDFLNSILNS